MNYEFSLSKTASISLIAGSVFISVLLFGAGLVVGSQWLVSDSTSAETIAKNEKTDVPAEPVLREEKPSVPKTPTAPNITAPAAPVPLARPLNRRPHNNSLQPPLKRHQLQQHPAQTAK
jgi:hypothetical protein